MPPHPSLVIPDRTLGLATYFRPAAQAPAMDEAATAGRRPAQKTKEKKPYSEHPRHAWRGGGRALNHLRAPASTIGVLRGV